MDDWEQSRAATREEAWVEKWGDKRAAARDEMRASLTVEKTVKGKADEKAPWWAAMKDRPTAVSKDARMAGRMAGARADKTDVRKVAMTVATTAAHLASDWAVS